MRETIMLKMVSAVFALLGFGCGVWGLHGGIPQLCLALLFAVASFLTFKSVDRTTGLVLVHHGLLRFVG